MPPQKSAATSVLAKLGNVDNAVREGATEATNWGFRELPPFRNGVAKLTKCYFDVYKNGDNAGKVFWRLEGTIVEAECDKGSVVGEQFSVMEPVHETTRTVDGQTVKVSRDEHVKEVMNQLRKLGVDTTGARTGADLDALCAAAVAAAPYFRCENVLSEEKLNPDGSVKYKARCWPRFYGVRGLEDYSPPDDGDGVDDATPAAPQRTHVNGSSPKAAARPAQARKSEPEPEPAADEYSDQEDLASLVERATADDTEAQERLQQMAADAGASEDDVRNAADWQAVADLIGGGSPEEEQEAAGAEEAPAEPPRKGDLWFARPVDAKTGKPAARGKRVEVEVLTSDARRKVATVKDVATGKVVVGKDKKPYPYGWDDLSGTEG